MKLSIVLMMGVASGLQLTAPQPRVAARSRCAVMEVADTCAMIELSTDDPIRVAQTLKRAWMEGGVKRGLKGSVLVPSDNMVTIVASGPRQRLDSFAEWIETESQLVSKVEFTDSCPASAAWAMSPKFALAEVAEEATTPWLELLNKATIDVEASAGKTHSSDEGLA